MKFNKRGNMKRGLIFGLVFLILLVSAHAQFFQPGAVFESFNEQVGGVTKYYEIQGNCLY